MAHVFAVANVFDIPIVGIGGIASGRDALEYMVVGASAVQVGTQNFVRTDASETIVKEMKDYLESHGINTVSSMIGTFTGLKKKLMSDDKRQQIDRSQRFPVHIGIDHSTIEAFLDSEIMNLSKGGVFIKADITLPLGTVVDFQFTLPNSEQSIKATGVVVWARSKKNASDSTFSDHPAGMGIQFKEIEANDLDFILDELERLMKIS